MPLFDIVLFVVLCVTVTILPFMAFVNQSFEINLTESDLNPSDKQILYDSVF